MTRYNKAFLVENSLSSYEKPFLLEMEGGKDALKRAMENPDIPIYMVGLIQKGDTPNRNKRIYPFEILKKECLRYLNEEIREKQSFGELDHPVTSAVPELKNAAMTLEDIWFDGNNVYGRIKILNAFMPQTAPGLIARGIILNGKTLGISSRALGSVYQDGSGFDIVDKDLEIICWDLVSRPSTIGANLNLVQQQVNEARLLTESINRKEEKRIVKTLLEANKLNEDQQVYLNILGVEKYLQLFK